MVDSTFASPFNQQPLALGADVSMHSSTKYLNGHSDIIGGVLVLNDDQLAEDIHFVRKSSGAVPGPMDAWLCLSGAKTLHVRMARHNENGLEVARWLEAHPKIRRVFYPGLKSHPDHAVAKAQMAGFGGVVTFELETDLEGAMRFIDATQIPYQAPSLGGVESLIELPITMSYWDVPRAERLAMGITDSLVRLACGVEDSDDLITDLGQALEQV